MLYNNVYLAGFGYELAPNVISSEDIENRLEPVYEKLHFQPGQLEALTGISERRFWDKNQKLSEGAVAAGRKAMNACDIPAHCIDMLIYGGVCRENLEPATACAVANGLGLSSGAIVYDVSNACLGVLNGMIHIANAIALGQIRAGMVVSAESSRQIMDLTIDRILKDRDMESFKQTIATLTGGSGAVAVMLCGQSMAPFGHRLLGGVNKNAAHHHDLCIWGPDSGIPASAPMVMRTDSVGILKHGIKLGVETYKAIKSELNWADDKPDKIICHQVGETHQRTFLQAIGMNESKDFTTFRYLGNIGTVSLPITAAIAQERDFFQPGDQVGFFGIGSGLNCIMLGLEW
ncbi:MAG: 3-oxoacyl-ACP synthase III [Desulfobacteraceae bacterium]|nr:3-oxoacyl-ACP synthase III [Desulfobacteraceae bacterium]